MGWGRARGAPVVMSAIYATCAAAFAAWIFLVPAGGPEAGTSDPLTGRIFFVAVSENHDRYVATMNLADGKVAVVSNEFSRVDNLVWYPGSQEIGISNTSGDSARAGWFSLLIGDVSKGALAGSRRTLPETFPVDFYDDSTRVTLSPNGSAIAGISIAEDDGEGRKPRMCVVSAKDATRQKCVLNVKACPGQSPVWSPDGTKIVFAGAMPEDVTSCNLMELFVANIETMSAVQLTNVPGPPLRQKDKPGVAKPGRPIDHWHRSAQPSWAPDGRWIAFVSYGRIFRVRPDGSDLQLLIEDGLYPAWSPDGRLLMYVKNAVGSAIPFIGARPEIVVASLDGVTRARMSVNASEIVSIRDVAWVE